MRRTAARSVFLRRPALFAERPLCGEYRAGAVFRGRIAERVRGRLEQRLDHMTVAYTHLDVYKRQDHEFALACRQAADRF